MTGEFLTRATVWLSILAYTAGTVVFALARRPRWDPAVRVAWTIACASLIAHFVSAFQFYHGWSHDAAYRETARQTQEMFGVNWGGGLFINYLLLVVWIGDISWWWLSGLNSYRLRPRRLLVAWHGFLVFIIFNATAVFADGIVRWVGGLVCLILAVSWVRFVGNGIGQHVGD
jgi:hypothetical protein